MANRDSKKSIELPDKLIAVCTDNDKEVEMDYVSQHNDMIRTSLQGIPLTFKHSHRNIYVANAHGREFVLKLTTKNE
jgi:hypothetical protein